MSIMEGLQRGNKQQGISMQDALKEVHDHPDRCYRQAGFQVPQEIIGNNQQTVMHLIRTGQVGGPMMKMISPLLGRMGIKI